MRVSVPILARGLILFVALPLAGGLASAQSAGGISPEVRITLQGHIAPRCDLSGAAATLDLGEVEPSAGGQKQSDFQLSCNAPFIYRLSSAQGGLRPENAAGGGFAAQLAYRATLIIEADGGGTASIDCSSAELVLPEGPCVGASGDSATAAAAILTVRWDAPSAPLIAGQYTDNLEMFFSIAH